MLAHESINQRYVRLYYHLSNFGKNLPTYLGEKSEKSTTARFYKDPPYIKMRKYFRLLFPWLLSSPFFIFIFLPCQTLTSSLSHFSTPTSRLLKYICRTSHLLKLIQNTGFWIFSTFFVPYRICVKTTTYMYTLEAPYFINLSKRRHCMNIKKKKISFSRPFHRYT